MPTTILKGLVIKKKNFQEFDLIVEIVTEKEFLTFIALGTRKLSSKNRFALEIGNIVEVEVFKARFNNKMSKLKKATLVFQPLIEKESVAQTISNLTFKINKSKKSFSPLLFKSIEESFEYLNTNLLPLVKTYVLFNFLDCLGIYPNKTSCIECFRKDRINSFSFEKGGFTCVFHALKPRPLEELQSIYALFDSFGKYKNTNFMINQQLAKEIENIIEEQMVL